MWTDREGCASVVSGLQSVELLTESRELHRGVGGWRRALALAVIKRGLICRYDLPALQNTHTDVKVFRLSGSFEEITEVSVWCVCVCACVRVCVCVCAVSASTSGDSLRSWFSSCSDICLRVRNARWDSLCVSCLCSLSL